MSKGVIFMLISTFCFSLMAVCVKFLKHIPAYELVLFRVLISLFLGIYLINRRKISPFGNNKKLLFTIGILGTVALNLFFVSLQELPLASAEIIANLSPIFTAAIAIFILKESVNRIQWFSFGLAFLGVILIKGFDGGLPLLFVGVAISAALIRGFIYNFVRKLRLTDDPLIVAFYGPLVATPVMIIFCSFNWVTPVGTDWLILLAMGTLAKIGQLYSSKALHQGHAAKITSIKFLSTVNALFFGILLFGESYTSVNIIGMLLVAGGIVLIIFQARLNKVKNVKGSLI